MKLIRKNTFNNDIVFIDGGCGSGKSLISKVLECYEGVEKSKEDDQFYVTQVIYKLGLIDINTATTILKIYTDRLIYNQMVGRDINTRPTDITSVLTYPYPKKYIQRQLSDGGQYTANIIQKENPIFQNMSQNALIYINLYIEAFGDRFKMIHINRKEKEVVSNTMKLGFGSRVGTDPIDTYICIEYKGESIPHYAISWKDEYLTMTPMERVTKWIKQENAQINKVYNSLNKDNREKVLFIDFDEFVKNPIPYCKKIEDFIKRNYDYYALMSVLSRERCPR
jgi:hypothetical protein